MAEIFDGEVQFRTERAPHRTILRIDPDDGDKGQAAIHLSDGDVVLPNVVVHDRGQITTGGTEGSIGALFIYDTAGQLKVDASTARSGGRLRLLGSQGGTGASLDGNGRIDLFDATEQGRVTLDDQGRIFLRDSSGTARIQTRGSDGSLRVLDNSGTERSRLTAGQLRLDDTSGQTRLHIRGNDGSLRLTDSNGTLRLEARGTSGQIYARDANGTARAFMGSDGNIRLWDSAGDETITIDGNAGDIILRNADFAEDFDVSDPTVEPGTVMTMGSDGKLYQSDSAYDKRVIGVVSGAGEYAPGLVLDRKQSESDRLPIALTGKVYCKVDTSHGPIEVGDLLTTADEPGRAMRAADPTSAFGAVLGKALGSLTEGQGKIPVLVGLR